MRVVFTRIFEKEIRSIKNKNLAAQVEEVILAVKAADSLAHINKLKKLSGHRNAYRIKIGDYRIGLHLEEQTLEFSRFLHRKEIYRYFP